MFSVRGADGKVYGPVDLDTLRQWATEGRLVPTTEVIEIATQRRMPASYVPGLFQNHPDNDNRWARPPQSPYPRSYASYNPTQASADLTTGWVFFALGAAGCVTCACLSLIFFPLAIAQANRPEVRLSQTAAALRILSIVFLVLSVLSLVLTFAMFGLPFM